MCFTDSHMAYVYECSAGIALNYVLQFDRITRSIGVCVELDVEACRCGCTIGRWASRVGTHWRNM